MKEKIVKILRKWRESKATRERKKNVYRNDMTLNYYRTHDCI